MSSQLGFSVSVVMKTGGEDSDLATSFDELSAQIKMASAAR
jgi:hypothetical protein